MATEGPLPCDACASCGRPTTVDDIDLRLETCEPPPRGPDEVLIEVRAAGVNRSDVAAAMGRMPQAVWPRTPGRDWAGVVIEGPDGTGRPARCSAPAATSASRATARMPAIWWCHRDAAVAKPRDADAGGGRLARRAVRHRAARGFIAPACRSRATWCW